jgi:hypothetical protein
MYQLTFMYHNPHLSLHQLKITGKVLLRVYHLIRLTPTLSYFSACLNEAVGTYLYKVIVNIIHFYASFVEIIQVEFTFAHVFYLIFLILLEFFF